MKIEDLKAAPYNPRRIGEKELAGLSLSLKSFGDISGIVWNKRTGHLVCGHQRISALQSWYKDELKIEGETIVAPDGNRYDIRIVDWDEPTEKVANIAANNPHIAGTFIQDDLDDIIRELQETEWASQLPDLNIEKLLTPEEAIEDGVLDESHIEVRAKLGDVWQLGNHRIACGDSTDEKVAKSVLRNDKPFMMVTDPPYGAEYDPQWRTKMGSLRRGQYIENDHIGCWDAAFKLFDGDVTYVWHGTPYTGATQFALEDQGFECRCMLIWLKQAIVISRGHYNWRHEPCWYAVRKGKTAKWCGDRKQSTIWEINSMMAAGGGNAAADDKTSHGCQKPVECMARPIRNHGEKGDYIYEPFSGSGTTIIACEQLERRCLAIELTPRYVDMALTRWEKLTGGRAERIQAGAE